MKKYKLCISLNDKYGIPQREQVAIAANAGFDGVFPCWTEEEKLVENLKSEADKAGIAIPAIHAPHIKFDSVWFGTDEEAAPALGKLYACLSDCADFGIPVIACHVITGYEDKPEPGMLGLGRFKDYSDKAAELGVVIAYENLEQEHFLAAVLEHLKNHPGAAFCWDTGHEMCYNFSKDLLSIWGDRLVLTHINDNLGFKGLDGRLTGNDDLHLLPFDGIGDWREKAERLSRAADVEYLTFEPKKLSKPGRHENDRYEKMTVSEFFYEAYNHAERFAKMVEKFKNKEVN